MKTKGLITNTALRVALCLLLCLPVSMGVATDSGLAGTARATKMTFTPKGMITAEEMATFKTYMRNDMVWPNEPLYRNHYVYGKEGKAIDACIQMFDITGDVDFLDFALERLNVEYYTRNGQPGGEKLVVADPFGDVPDVWPVRQEKTDADGNVTETYYSAAVEQGEALESFAYAARLIIDNPVLWNKEVRSGDPYNYGATYLERAKFFLNMCDKMYDDWLCRFVNPADKVFYRHNGTELYEPIAFNQAFMACNGLDMMAQCHARLGNVERAAAYDAIVLANIKAFVDKMWMDDTLEEGKTYIQWRYSNPKSGRSAVEDIGHASFDVYMLYNIYIGGRHNHEDIGMNRLTGTDEKGMLPLLEEISKTIFGLIYGKGVDSEGKFPGRINGNYEERYRDNYVRDYFFGLLDIMPEWYDEVCKINKTRYTGNMPIVSRMLWAKSRRIAAPVNITATPDKDGNVTLKWGAAEGKVTVMRSDDLRTWTTLGTADCTAGSYSDKTNPSAKMKQYKLVRTLNDEAGYSGIVTVTMANNISDITAEAPQQARSGIYSLNGTLIRKHSSDIEGLPKGIYIIKGKKVIL